MRVNNDLERDIKQGWKDKRKLVVRCARELGNQLWDYDEMYGNRRDRNDHEAMVALLGLTLGESSSAEEFINKIREIRTPS